MTFKAVLEHASECPGVEQSLVPAMDNPPFCALQLTFSSSLLLRSKVLICTISNFIGIGKPEINDDGISLDVLEENIVWFDVPVSDTSIVHVV